MASLFFNQPLLNSSLLGYIVNSFNSENKITVKMNEEQVFNPDSPIPSESACSSTESDIDITEALRCNLCDRGITVQFRDCSHAMCTRCTKNLWWSRVKNYDHYPAGFPCPWCRTEIKEVGMLLRETPEPGDVVVHGGVSFTVCIWEGVVEWMAWRSKRLAARAKKVIMATANNRGGEPLVTQEELENLTPEEYFLVYMIVRDTSIGWDSNPRLTVGEIANLSHGQQLMVLGIAHGAEEARPRITREQLENLTLEQYFMVFMIARETSVGWDTDPRLTIEELDNLTPGQQQMVFRVTLIPR